MRVYESQQPPLPSADLLFEQTQRTSDDRFKLGRLYSIRDRQYDYVVCFYNPISGRGCLFRFDGIKGRHYCFTEISSFLRLGGLEMKGYHKDFTPSFVISNMDIMFQERLKRGLTRTEAATAGKVSVRAIDKYEHREQTPSKGTYNRLAALFDWKVWK